MAVHPTERARRSFLYREQESAGASFEELNGSTIAMDYGDAEGEATQGRKLGICDLSALQRTGFKGWNMADWLGAQGAVMAEDSNITSPQADGTRVARLAPGEALVLGDYYGGGTLVEKLNSAWSMEGADGCYQVPRAETNFWLALTGADTPALFTKICAVDLREQETPVHSVVQTNVARLNAIIIRGGTAEMPMFDLLSDIASAVYLWHALLDAMGEFGGKPVGLKALHDLI